MIAIVIVASIVLYSGLAGLTYSIADRLGADMASEGIAATIFWPVALPAIGMRLLTKKRTPIAALPIAQVRK